MEILEGALAFSLVMIILATVVTGITETYLRTLRRRQAMLAASMRQMLRELSLREDPPVLARPNADQISAYWQDHSDHDWPGIMVDELTINLAVGTLQARRMPWYKTWLQGLYLRAMRLGQSLAFAELLHAEDWERPAPKMMVTTTQSGWFRKMLSRWWWSLWSMHGRNLAHRDRIDELSVRGFAERLARCGAYGAILSTVERNTLHEVISSFARYKSLTSERYRKYAQRSAIWIAIVVAFAFNIDAGRIFLHVMTDNASREALIAEAPNIASEYQALLTRLDEADQNAGLSADERTTQVAEIQARLDALEKLYDGTLGELVENRTLPIGFEYYPHCRLLPALEEMNAVGPGMWENLKSLTWPSDQIDAIKDKIGATDAACVRSEGETQNWLVWGVNVLIAGFLVGLGGPFWYKVFNGLSRLSQLLGKPKGAPLNSEVLDGETKAKDAPTRDEEINQAVDAAWAILEQRGLKPTTVTVPLPEA